MAIAFDQIPAGELVPFFYAEVKQSPSPFNAALRVLLVGPKSGGVAVKNTPYLLSSTEARRLFGTGHMIEAMYRKGKLNAPYVEFWGLGTDTDVGAAYATSTILVNKDILYAGSISVWIGGYQMSVPVNKGDLAATVAGRIKTKINNNPFMPCTAAITSSHPARVDLTCKWKGTSGNAIRVEYGTFGGFNQIADDHLTIDVSKKFTLGSGSHDIAGALAAIHDMQFDVVVTGPQTTSGILDKHDSLFDEVSGRWSPSLQLYGHGVCCTDDTVANLVTLGAARNGPHVSVIPATNAPTPPWEWAASLGAIVGQHLAAPPECSRPLQTLPILGCEPSRDTNDWYTHDEKASLLAAGISTYDINLDRSVSISRIVTTYKTNAWGDPDASWRDIETLFQNMYFVRYLRAAITGAFPRCALTDNDTGIEGFVSVKQIKEFVIHEYRALEAVGLVENSDLFAEVLVVERDAVDHNRVNLLVPIDVVNQLRIFAMRVESNLQLTDSPLLASAA